MNPLRSAAVIAAIVIMSGSAAFASHQTALSKVAVQLGFDYAYLGPEDAVTLTRPGVTILIRPGERLFDVNDRTEAMDGPAPQFENSDIFISDKLLARLRSIAGYYPGLAGGDHGLTITHASPYGSVTGTISGLSVAGLVGKQEIAVSGKAPANLPITLTLVASLASEIPDVILSRHEVTADSDGTFKADVSIAPGYFHGAILTLVASSIEGVAPAKAQIYMKSPNGTKTLEADQIPKAVRNFP